MIGLGMDDEEILAGFIFTFHYHQIIYKFDSSIVVV